MLPLHTGKKYVLLDYLSVACMSVGLVMFTLADSQVQPSFDLFGESTRPLHLAYVCLHTEWNAYVCSNNVYSAGFPIPKRVSKCRKIEGLCTFKKVSLEFN